MDFDGDGAIDILSGSWPGELYFFRNGKDGKFLPGEKIKDDTGKELNPGSASTAFAVDYDNDGDLDLLCGCINGEAVLYPNMGTTAKPSFVGGRKIAAAGKPIKVKNGDSHPILADWDSDGKPDLIVGTGGGSVIFYRNTGTKESPEFGAGQPLLAQQDDSSPVAKSQSKESIGTRLKVCVCDYNGDGHLDLIVGDFNFCEPETDNLKEKTKVQQDAEKKLQELREKNKHVYTDLNKAIRVPPNEDPDAKAKREKKLKELRAEIRKASEEEMPYRKVIAQFGPKFEYHGWVWLFLRK